MSELEQASFTELFRPLIGGRSVLLLEDEQTFADPILTMLRLVGADPIDHFTVGEAARDAAQTNHYDVLLLDRMNSGMDGLSVLREVRSGNGPSANAPALMVTSLGDPAQRVDGLVAGADDYVPKPVTEIELLARVAAQLRRSAQPAPTAAAADTLTLGPLALSLKGRNVTFAGQPFTLTTQCFTMLAELVRASGQPLSKTMLFERCWPEWTFFPEGWENTLYKAIDRLRTALQPFETDLPAHLKPMILNVRGQGYILRDISEIET